MEASKIKVDELKLSDIVTEFSRGEIRIPRFQRNYVWDRPRVVKLLNSIYKEYPIGTFFFWEAPGEYMHLYRNIPELNIPEPDKNTSFNFILDGQQRITSLYVAIKGLTLNIEDSRSNPRKIDYSEISFDLDKEEFVIKRPDNERFVSLSSILEQSHMQLFRSLTDDRAAAFDRCYKRFNGYPLSVVYVRNQTLSEACEIFERINQGGIKLSIFDLVVASTWSAEFDLKEEVNKLNKEFNDHGFGAIPPETILQTISLVVRGQATRPAELQLTSEDIIQVWKSVSESLKLTLDYLSLNLGAKIIEFIPYISMIPMISYLYAKKQNKGLSNTEKKFLEEWFWKCTFSGRYNSSTATLMGEDRRDLFDLILQGKDVIIDYPIAVTSDSIKNTKMYRYTAVRNGILCILSQKQPKHFVNGSNIQLNRTTLSDYNSSERHHIFPKAFLKKLNAWNENSIANFCFIPAELNSEISDTPPNEYLSKFKKSNPVFDETMKSHIIPTEQASPVWTNEYDIFLSERSELLVKEIEKKIGKITPIDEILENNPEMILSSLEESFRVIVNDNLVARYGEEYWKQSIPGDIQEGVKQRIKLQDSRYAGKAVLTSLEKLSFCDFSDYRKIITKYWGLFEDEFDSLGDFERNYIFLQDYRNAIRHVKDMNSIQKKQGEAAAEWFMNKITVANQRNQENEN